MIYFIIDLLLITYLNINTYFILFYIPKAKLIAIISLGLLIDMIIINKVMITIPLVIIYFIYHYGFKRIIVFRKYILFYLLSFIIIVNIHLNIISFFIFFITTIFMYFFETKFINSFRG